MGPPSTQGRAQFHRCEPLLVNPENTRPRLRRTEYRAMIGPGAENATKFTDGNRPRSRRHCVVCAPVPGVQRIQYPRGEEARAFL
jgi:hypothetical protein